MGLDPNTDRIYTAVRQIQMSLFPPPAETSQQSIIRRIAERGLMVAQQEENSQMIDCWQNMLDEIEILETATHQSEEEKIDALIKRMKKGNG